MTLLSSSAFAFSVIKYAGAVYLIYLGISSFFSRKNVFEPNKEIATLPLKKIFSQGVITNVLNPKVALFFLAFLPQFIHAGKISVQWQILILGAWFNISGTLVNILVAILFGKMGSWLANKEWFIKWQQKITGFLLFGLGIKIALQSRK